MRKERTLRDDVPKGAIDAGAARNASVPKDRRIDFRVGINLGEVVMEGSDRHGEDVNIAARLQQLADAGGIRISSKAASDVEKQAGAQRRADGLAETKEHQRTDLSLSGKGLNDGSFSARRKSPGLPSKEGLPIAAAILS